MMRDRGDVRKAKLRCALKAVLGCTPDEIDARKLPWMRQIELISHWGSGVGLIRKGELPARHGEVIDQLTPPKWSPEVVLAIRLRIV